MKIRSEAGGAFVTLGAPEGQGRDRAGEIRFTSPSGEWSVRPRQGSVHQGYDLFEAGSDRHLASSTGNGHRWLPATIQLADGRFFVVEPEAGDAFSVFDEAGLGPYWCGRPSAQGFDVETTVAGGHVAAAEALLVLLAVHLTRR